MRTSVRIRLLAACLVWSGLATVDAQEAPDALREAQFRAAELETADWVHWGDQPAVFSNWTNHSNRLIPVYTFGISLDKYQGQHSVYRDAAKLEALYGQLPTNTLNPQAEYFDQTDIYRLQQDAFAAGKKHIILFVFDGMDWDTTQAASIYKNKEVLYTSGRGAGLHFLDYQTEVGSFGFCVTSPHDGSTDYDVNAQVLTAEVRDRIGGYDWELGGSTPWAKPGDPSYLLSRNRNVPHPYTDSAASGTSLNAGAKTFNAAINVSYDGRQLETFAHKVQEQGFSIGVVSSVPISHATPACVYSHNVTRNDYQDLTRDMLGLPSIAHRENALPGVDVLIGCGWGDETADDRKKQGNNFMPGNKYLAEIDLETIDAENGGNYVVAMRTAEREGADVLAAATEQAIADNKRLFGFFGTSSGHLPYQTADGKFDPTRGVNSAERYDAADILENPTLAQMTAAALKKLGTNDKGFFLMVEAGDVDWANHNNNLDDSIGAVFSGDDAFHAVTQWVEKNSNWDESCVIVTADHGHMLVLEDPEMLTGKRKLVSKAEFEKLRVKKQEADAAKRREKEAPKKVL